MRESFTDNEKNILRQISENLKEKERGVFLSNILDNDLTKVILEFNSNNSVVIKSVSNDNIVEVNNIIIDTIMLLNEFERENFIMLINNVNVQNEYIPYGQGNLLVNPTNPFLSWTVPDDLKDMMIAYFNKQIFCSSALHEFIDNGFIMNDVKRFNKSIKFAWYGIIAAWCGIIIAIVIGVISIFISLCK
jgi:hypothetical protein